MQEGWARFAVKGGKKKKSGVQVFRSEATTGESLFKARERDRERR